MEPWSQSWHPFELNSRCQLWKVLLHIYALLLFLTLQVSGYSACRCRYFRLLRPSHLCRNSSGLLAGSLSCLHDEGRAGQHVRHDQLQSRIRGERHIRRCLQREVMSALLGNKRSLIDSHPLISACLFQWQINLHSMLFSFVPAVKCLSWSVLFVTFFIRSIILILHGNFYIVSIIEIFKEPLFLVKSVDILGMITVHTCTCMMYPVCAATQFVETFRFVCMTKHEMTIDKCRRVTNTL